MLSSNSFQCPQRITLAFTGASGLPYGIRLLAYLLENGYEVALICSPAAHIVAKEEMKWTWPKQPAALKRWFLEHLQLTDNQYKKLAIYGPQDWNAPMASGSNVNDAMVICPCTMGTLAGIAAGLSDSLIERAADVSLKEKRTLVLVPRETPFSTLHLQNMLRLSEMGVVIVPPIPAFYHQPQTMEDMVDFVVSRILDQIAVPNTLIRRWNHQENPV